MDAECKWLQCTGSSLSLGFRLLSTKAAQRPALARLVLDARSDPHIFQTFWGCVSAAFLAIAFPMSNPVMLTHCERPPSTGPWACPSGILTSSTELLSEKPPHCPQVTVSSSLPRYTSKSFCLLLILSELPYSDAPPPF